MFALWLAHEARTNPQLEGYRQVFVKVGADVAAERIVDGAEAELLYGVIRGHARAWGYLKDYEVDPKLYLSHYIASVGDDAGVDN